jgi:hypothetical protein
MNDRDMEQLLLTHGYALRDVMEQMEILRHRIRIIEERLSLINAALMIEKVEEGIPPQKLN